MKIQIKNKHKKKTRWWVNKSLNHGCVRMIFAENYISTNPKSAGRYACDVLKKRWPEAENNILRNIFHATIYSGAILKARWPALELEISKSSDEFLCFNYAIYVCTGRFELGEHTLLSALGSQKTSWITWLYLLECVRGPWLELEEKIILEYGWNSPEMKQYHRDLDRL